MLKNEEVLNAGQLEDLLRSGLNPEFRSLGGIFQDAAKQGSLTAYRELVKLGRVNQYSSTAYEAIGIMARLSDADMRDLLEISLENATSAIHKAARLGYNRYTSQRS